MMRSKEFVFGMLAILGVVLPWYYNIQFMQSTGSWTFDVPAFVEAGYANAASSSLSVDLGVGTITYLVWMLVETRRLGMKHAWLYFASTCLIAFACSFPLFLLMRERHLRKQETTVQPLAS